VFPGLDCSCTRAHKTGLLKHHGATIRYHSRVQRIEHTVDYLSLKGNGTLRNRISIREPNTFHRSLKIARGEAGPFLAAGVSFFFLLGTILV